MQHAHASTLKTSIGRIAGLVAAVLAFLAVPGLDAQAPEAEGQQELMTELRQVNQQLAGIEQQAMQDPELQEQRAATEATVIAAMTELDPETEQKLDRMGDLQSELQTAQQEGDQEEMGSLLQEQRQLEQSLQQTQAQALEKEEVAASLESFRESLVSAMIEIDPTAEQLLERQEELQTELTPPPGG